MLRRLKPATMALALAGAVTGTAYSAAPTAMPGRYWTIQDEVEVPAIMETVVSDDGQVGLVLVRKDHLDTNSREFRLLEVNLGEKTMGPSLSAKWISRIDNIPNSQDWSMLADLGKGVQLYRLTRDLKVEPIIERSSTTVVGSDYATAITNSVYDFDQAFGVFDYGWAKDGQSFWYSTGHLIAKAYRRPTVQIKASMPYATLQPNVSELHIATLDGRDRLIASGQNRTNPHTIIAFQNQAAYWDYGTSDGRPRLNFSVIVSADGADIETKPKQYDPAANIITDGNAVPVAPFIGASGGLLQGRWLDGHWWLSEADGKEMKADYGAVDFPIGGFWSSRSWYYPTLGVAAIPVRHEAPYRSDLVKLDRAGKVSSLEPSDSLTHCALAEARPVGICIRESLRTPPTVVAVDVSQWRLEPVGAIDPTYSEIIPLVSKPHVWTVGNLSASGFIVYPRGFQSGGKYPAILLTHGYDADNSFAYWGLQWSYPVQLWAERGYVVLCVNDVPVGNPQERLAATMQWNTGKGTMPADRVYQIGWLDHLKIYRVALNQLAAEETIDPKRVGIVGYSRGSQMTNIAVSQTSWFRAASSGDGSFFSPTSYWTGGNRTYYFALFGGGPSNPLALPRWRRLSPAFRANKVSAAVLFQSAANKAGMQDFYGALQEAGVPADYVDFQDETHLFHLPINRALAMEQNLDWFDFWLRDQRDPSPAKDSQYSRWQAMKDQWKRRQ